MINKLKLIGVLLIAIFFGLSRSGSSGAYLSDTETAGVSMTAGTWDTDPPSDPAPELVVPASLDVPEATPTPADTIEETATPEATPTPTDTPTETPSPTPTPDSSI